MFKTIKRTAFALAVIVFSYAVLYSFVNVPPHEFNFLEGECKTCHIDFWQPLRFTNSITALCNECHGSDNVISHIVDVVPSMYVGEAFPLDEGGRMTCNTCHYIHMDRLDAATGERTYLLRTKEKGKQFCDSCHAGTIEFMLENLASSHSDKIDRAHFGYYTTATHFLDQASLYCISCHDGDIATHVPLSLSTGSPMESHPVGVDYLEAVIRNRQLKHPRFLDPAIKLVNGKLSCISCHNIFSLKNHKLAIDNRNSRLCLECHIK